METTAINSIDLDKYNQYPTFRKGQREAIIEVLQQMEKGAKVIELNAPTSAGKSILHYVIAKAALELGFIDRCVITTPQKTLIAQYENEKTREGDPWFDGIVLGRANYTCALDPMVSADARTCRKAPRDPACSNCEYQIARTRFADAQLGLTTMAYYLTGYSPESEREMVIIDESATLESDLIERFNLKIPLYNNESKEWEYHNLEKLEKDKTFEGQKLFRAIEAQFKTQQGIFNSPEGLSDHLEEWALFLAMRVKDLNDQLEALRYSKGGKKKEIAKELNKFEREEYKCKNILAYIKGSTKYHVNKNLEFKLIFGKVLFNRISKAVKHVILSSGTPTTKLVADEYESVVMDHPISRERRLVFVNPVGSMSSKNRYNSSPKLAEEIAKLHDLYKKHTIVHCHSYGIAALIYDQLKRCTNANIVIQRNDEGLDREMYKNKWVAQKNSIFLSVAFTTGLNLKGPEYPLNIIIKVPFAYLGDEWIKARSSFDNDEYSTLMSVIDIEQSAGRCTRDINDFSITVILDSDWLWWGKRNSRYFEPWFIAAIEKFNINEVQEVSQKMLA
jgi:Rad3-related DNA helicase